ncbi:MAG: ABC transporter permease [Thiopseudomonas sp.]|nr:ABC transporter permease [Thiopseudomonas sp.]MCK9465146.1 ABC transporter permease [Thiopseudomonas sp.]
MKIRFLTIFNLAIKQSLREVRSPELYTLFFALVVAVASSSTIAHFADRLHQAMQLRASEFLAADLVVSGSIISSESLIEQGLALGLETAQTVSFATMLSSKEGMHLASIKAVNEHYPLRGALKSSTRLGGMEHSGGQPSPGEVWLDVQLFNLLSIQPGDTLEIGAAELIASHVLTYEPDSAGGFSAFTPRVIMNIADLSATQAIQPGSRIHYRQLWRGDAQALARYSKVIESQLAPQQKIEQLSDGNPQLNNALERAQQYLNLASLAAILLASVSIALSASNFANKRYDHAALLRCFGLSRQQTLLLFTLQLLLLGLIASLVGIALGWLGQQTLFGLLADLLPEDIPPASAQASLTALLTGLISLFGFGLPPLIALGQVSPLRVLRRDLQPMPTAAWLIYALAIAALALIMWRLSLDLRLTLIILFGGLVFALILGAGILLLLKRLTSVLAQRNLAWRLGLGHLLRKPLLAAGQILAFALIIFAMALVVLLRSELLDNWQQQLPEQAANHFAFNIMPHEKPELARQLQLVSPQIAEFYPMTPGRLTHINDQPVLQRLAPDSPALTTVQRDLNLTWTEQVPKDNQVTDGQWWSTTSPSDLIEISVEQELAKRLNLQLGDTVTFNLGGQVISSRVSNFRSVDWGSMQPNFFVIFSPERLGNLPYTWITSFYLAPEKSTELRQLNQNFPAVSLLRIEALLGQLRAILAQVTLAVEFILLFVLAAGITVLLAGVQSTLASRILQGALLRALGTQRQLLLKVNLYEFSTLGLASGVLAWLGCELTSFLLYTYVFKLSWQPHLWLLLLPLLGAVLINIAGLVGTRKVLKSSPLRILRSL